MHDNGVVGELRAINGDKRIKYMSLNEEHGTKTT
jgi:hypothetical protein